MLRVKILPVLGIISGFNLPPNGCKLLKLLWSQGCEQHKQEKTLSSGYSC